MLEGFPKESCLRGVSHDEETTEPRVNIKFL